MIKLNKALIGGSLVLLITFNLFNIINFIFQFSMVRLLSIVEYGVLATLFSIIYIFGIFSESIQTIMAKFSSIEHDKGRIKNLLKKSLTKAVYISFLVFAFYLIISIPLSYLLKINYLLLALNGLLVFVVFLLPVNRGVMLGKKMFKGLGINMIIEASAKLFIALLLVYLGLKIYGAIVALVIGAAVAFLFSFSTLKEIFSSEEKQAETNNIYQYAKPVAFITLIITVFYSLDIIIAKIVFPAEIAGYYAIASILGKIAFWGTQPISKAMFPLSAETGSKKKASPNVLWNALGILGLCLVVYLAIIYLFPAFFIKIFSGRDIPQSISILFYITLAMSILSVTNLFLLYKLSLGKIKDYYLFLIFPLIEIFLLIYFSHSLLQFSVALVTASAIFLWGVIFLIDRK